MEWKNAHLGLSVDSAAGTAALVNLSSDREIAVSLRAPRLDFGDMVWPGGDAPISLRRRNTAEGPRWAGSYAPTVVDGVEAHITVWLQAYKKKPYVRKGYELTLNGRSAELPFREIEMDRVDLAGMSPTFHHRGDLSIPILSDSFFLGVEFPVSAARLEDSTAILASRPGIYLRTGDAFKSRDVVYAVTEPGKAAKCFRDYVEEFRAQPADIFFGYNNWWTTPLHQNNDMIVDLAKTVKRNLFDAFGVAPDDFTLDLGWSDPHTIWEIDREKFPNGFSDLKKVLDEMGTGIGFWISPPSSYPQGLDNNWARDLGYEVFKHDHWVDVNLCVAGPKYSRDIIKNATDIVRSYGVKNIKFDAYIYHCPEPDHGHLPGEYSAEPIAQHMIDFYETARAASPGLRIYVPQKDRVTVFGESFNCRFDDLKGGPWWMKHVHFMSCMEGDDYPYGRCPAPVHRDTYTTARSFRVLKSSLDPLIPVDCKEAFGVISQTEESLANDAVEALMRGHLFISLYLNVNKMSSEDWGFIARIIKYGRANRKILRNTTTLFPESWKQPDGTYKPGSKAMRDPYGYVHTDGKRALVYLRNPSIGEQTRTVRLDEANGFPDNGFVWNAVSVFPCRRTYGRDLRCGDEIAIRLQPHQNVLLEFSAKEPTAPSLAKAGKLSVSDVDCRLAKDPARADLTCSVEADHKVNKLMVLVETDKEPETHPTVSALINGEQSPVELIAAKDGWHSDAGPMPENWTWHVVTLPQGKSRVDLSVEISSKDALLSVWLWGESPVRNPGRPPLLHPKPVDRESVPILSPTAMH